MVLPRKSLTDLIDGRATKTIGVRSCEQATSLSGAPLIAAPIKEPIRAEKSTSPVTAAVVATFGFMRITSESKPSSLKKRANAPRPSKGSKIVI